MAKSSTNIINVGRCGPRFNHRTCGSNGDPSWAIYCNESNGWCGQTDAHMAGSKTGKYDKTFTRENMKGRCGPLFSHRTCGSDIDPEWAIYCNESSGWCGETDAHQAGSGKGKYNKRLNVTITDISSWKSNTFSGVDHSVIKGLKHIIGAFPGYIVNGKIPIDNTKLRTVEASLLNNNNNALCFYINEQHYCTIYSHQNKHLLEGVRLGLDFIGATSINLINDS